MYQAGQSSSAQAPSSAGAIVLASTPQSNQYLLGRLKPNWQEAVDEPRVHSVMTSVEPGTLNVSKVHAKCLLGPQCR